MNYFNLYDLPNYEKAIGKEYGTMIQEIFLSI